MCGVALVQGYGDQGIAKCVKDWTELVVPLYYDLLH